MAAGDAIAAPQNQVIALAEVIGKLLPSLFGKQTSEKGSENAAATLAGTGTSNSTGTSSTTVDGKTGETTSGTAKKNVDPQTQAQIDQLMATLMPTASGATGSTDAVVANILRKATEAFAPTLGQQNQAGVHNSSTNALLRNDAIARAVGEASTAVLTAQQQAAATAASLLKTTADANSSVVNTGTKAVDTVQKQGVTEQKAGTTSENKSTNTTTNTTRNSETNPLLGGVDPISGILMAALTAYAGNKLKKFASPYLDSVFGSDGGSLTSAFSSADLDAISTFYGGGTPVEAGAAAAKAAADPLSSSIFGAGEEGLVYTATDKVAAAGGGGLGEGASSLTQTIIPDAVDGAIGVGGNVSGALLGTGVESILPSSNPFSSETLRTDAANDLYQGGIGAGVPELLNTSGTGFGSETLLAAESNAVYEGGSAIAAGSGSGAGGFSFPAIDPFSAVAAVVGSFILDDVFDKHDGSEAFKQSVAAAGGPDAYSRGRAKYAGADPGDPFDRVVDGYYLKDFGNLEGYGLLPTSEESKNAVSTYRSIVQNQQNTINTMVGY